MNKNESKIELMHYLNVFWKRKWFIIIATSLLIAATAGISFLQPQEREVYAIVEPSKSVTITGEGLHNINFFVPLNRIATLINQGVYNNMIATELNLNVNNIPKLTAEVIGYSSMVRISTKEKDVEKAKLILNSLCNYLKRNLDIHADNKIKEIDSQIKPKEMEKSILEEEIKSYKNKLDIISKRKQEIEKEMSDTRKKIEELKKERRLILKREKRSESENLSIILNSNEILLNSMNSNALNELFGNKIIEEENISLEINAKVRLKYPVEKEIVDLNEIKKRIYYAQINKEPTLSTSPASLKKLTNVLIAGILGLLTFGMLAFFLEYIEKQKLKLKTKKSDM